MLLCVLWPDKAPLSKGLLLVLNGLTVVVALLPQTQDLFTYNLQAVQQHQQVPPPFPWVEVSAPSLAPSPFGRSPSPCRRCGGCCAAGWCVWT